MRLLITTIGLFLCLVTTAQDAYFTQFFAAATDFNPALTGAIDGSFRVSAVYRDQWGGLIDNPYQTTGAFGDLRFEIGERTGGQDYAGIGLGFTADRVSVFDMNATGIRISGAYHKQLDKATNQYLSGGLYLGLVQRNINIESLTFHDEFNGLDGFTFSTQENLPENNYAHGDLGLGLNYTISPSKKTRFGAGAAIIHIVQPSVSFYSRSTGFDNIPDLKLYQKVTGYLTAEIAANESVSVLPRVAYIQQGPHRLINFGTNVKFAVNDHNSNAFHVGGGIRLARTLGSLEPSAFSILAGYELKNLLIGLTYDWNLDDLFNERAGQGVFELSITYIGEYENTSTFCPTF